MGLESCKRGLSHMTHLTTHRSALIHFFYFKVIWQQNLYLKQSNNSFYTYFLWLARSRYHRVECVYVCLSHIVKLRKPEAWPKILQSFVIGIYDLIFFHIFQIAFHLRFFNKFYLRNPSTFSLSM